jgi:hypothetical protein
MYGLLTLGSQTGIAQSVVVRTAPPPPVHAGVIGRPPASGYVWTAGYYRWDGRRYVWVPLDAGFVPHV